MVEKAKIKLKKSKNYLVYAVRYVIYVTRLFWWKINHDSKWTRYTKYIISPFKKVKKLFSPYVQIIYSFFKKYLKRISSFFEKHPKIKWTTVGTIILLLITIPLYIWWSSIPRAPKLKITSNGDYLYFAEGKDFTAFLGDRNTNTPTIQFEVEGGSVKFTPASGPTEMMEPARENRTLTFRNVYQNIDYQYQTIPKGIKEDIIIREPTIIKNFPFFVDFQGAKPKYFTENLAGGVFYDENGKYIFHFEKPYAVDANGERTEDVQLLLKREASSGRYVAVIGIDPEWAHAKGRAYPIRIDPTVVHDTSSEFAAGQLNRVFDTGSGSSPNLETYYQELPADENTVGLWHMNDNVSGNGQTISDSSGNGNDGTTDDGANNTGMDCTVSGQFDLGCQFDGTDDLVQVTNSTELNPQNITVSVWAKSDTSTWNESGFLVSKRNAYIMHPVVSSRDVRFYIYDGSFFNTTFTASSSFDITKWHHYVGTYDGEQIKIYVDGELKGTSDHSGSINTSDTGNLFIGHDDGQAGRYFDGVIDEVRISDIARAPEEIKLASQRRPYSVFRSSTIDLGTSVTSLDSLSWTELGVTTGDGETVADSTNLVAQWNFNETSGTTANNDAEGSSCGGTPANCDASLTNFSNTTGQDVAAGSGWTSDNRRWGAGSLMFDGGNDVASVSDNSALTGMSALTLSAWVKADTVNDAFVHFLNKDDTSDRSYHLRYSPLANDSTFTFLISRDGTGNDQVASSTAIEAGKWFNVVGVWDGNSVAIYINGVKENESGSGLSGSIFNSTDALTFGASAASTNAFDGVVDNVQIYSRALSDSEILANYNAGQIEFQTRTSADSSTWEAWKPTTNETQVLALDEDMTNWSIQAGESKPNITLQDVNDSAPTGPTGCSSSRPVVVENFAHNSSLSNYAVLLKVDHLSGMATDFTDLRFTNSSGTNLDHWVESSTSSDQADVYVEVDSIPVNGTTTIYMWYDSCTGGNSSNASDTLVWADGFDTDTSASYTIQEHVNRGGGSGFVWDTGNSELDSDTSNDDLTLNRTTSETGLHVWSTNITNGDNDGVGVHIKSSSTWYEAYLTNDHNFTGSDGIATQGSSGEPSLQSGTANGYGYNRRVGITYYDGTFKMYVDRNFEAEYSATITPNGFGLVSDGNSPAATYQDLYARKYVEPEPVAYVETSPGQPFIEGNGSLKIEQGIANYETEMVASWNLDETNGDNAGDDVFDSSPNNYNGEFNGTNIASSVVDGVVGKARSFNGSDDYIEITGYNGIGGSNERTVEAWVKSGSATDQAIVSWGENTTGNKYIIRADSTNGNVLRVEVNGGYEHGSTNILDGKWHHIAVVFPVNSSNVTNHRLYVDGQEESVTNLSQSMNTSTTRAVQIGQDHHNRFWNGEIDEVRIYDSERTAEEILESYRMGREHRVNRTISSTDLSSKGKLPFYVAADKPGTYLEATVGESGHVNNTSDTNSAGTWHLEEKAGSGAYIKDSSGNGNHGTPTGTSVLSGKVGLARDFNGATNYISMGDPATLDVTGTFTISAWINFPSSTNNQTIYSKTNGSTAGSYWFFKRRSGLDNALAFQTFSGGNNILGDVPPADEWQHVAIVYNSGTGTLYQNGQETGSGSLDTVTATSINAEIGRRGDGGQYAEGSIDEVRVSDTAYSAEQIRQLYDIGRRTHPVTIDFAASLDSGNLITGSGDTSFTVDATTHGLSDKGSQLFEDDKIIVKENVDGTEYIAQGDVTSVNESTGAVTVDAWDSGSTFPGSGFTANATVFKWQREYFDITEPLDSQINATTNLTLRVTDGSEGRTVWLDDIKSAGDYMTNDGGSAISSTVQRYFQYKAILSSTDTVVSPSLTSVTLSYTDNVVPGAPSLVANFLHDKLKTSDTTPEIRFSATDSDGDDLSYQVQWDTDSSFPSPTTAVSDTDPGFSNITTPADTDPFNSGDTISYTWQSALSDGTTYFYRVRAKDPGGSNTYGSFSSTRSFTIDTSFGDINGWFETHEDQFSTDTLTGNAQVNSSGHIEVTSSTGTARSTAISSTNIDSSQSTWGELQFTDDETNGDIKYKIYYDDAGTPTIVPDVDLSGNSTGFDTSPVDLTGLSTTTYETLYAYAELTFSGGSPQLQDWTVKLNVEPEIPSLDSPSNGATGVSLTPTLLTTTTDGDGNNIQYKIELCTDVNMTQNCQTFDQTQSQTGWSGQDADGGTTYTSGTQASFTVQSNLSVGTTYYWRSYGIDPSGTNVFGSTQGTPNSFTTNDVPNTPTLDSPADTATNQSLTPDLKTTATDPDSDNLQYKIELCTDSAMTQNCQTFDQTSSQTGWSGQNADGGTTYTSGTQATFTVQSALNADTTYYWRSYAIDPNGTNTFGSTQGTPFSFTTSKVPTQPTSLEAEGQINPAGVSDSTPEFTAICNDPDSGDTLNKYRIQVDDNQDFSSVLWDSGASGTSMTDCTEGARSSEISFGGTPLSFDGTTYYWKIKFWDAAGNEGPYSTEHAQFTMSGESSAAPTSCRIQESSDDSSLTLLWEDNSTSETQFRIEKNTNSGGFTFLANAAADATSHEDTNVSQGNTYQYRVRAENGGNTDWCTTDTVSLQSGTFQFKGVDLKGFDIE